MSKPWTANETIHSPYGTLIEGESYSLKDVPKEIIKAWSGANPRPLITHRDRGKLPTQPSMKE